MSSLLLLVYVNNISKLVLHGELFLFTADTRINVEEEVGMMLRIDWSGSKLDVGQSSGSMTAAYHFSRFERSLRGYPEMFGLRWVPAKSKPPK